MRCHDIPFIRQGNRLYFNRPTIKKWLEKKQNIECITNMEEFKKFMTPTHGATEIDDSKGVDGLD